MDMELAMRQALGEQRFYEHTDIRAGNKALQLSAAEPEPKKRQHVIRHAAPAYRPLLEAVAAAHGIESERILCSQRDDEASYARGHFFWEAQLRSKLSFADVGKLLQRDHSVARANIKRFIALKDRYTTHIEKVREACQ